MKPSARIICHSVNSRGIDLLTFEITAHRWILAEINTHRVLSKNYRSSRAVPVAKLLREVRENPAMPVQWLKNKPGMVASEPMTTEEEAQARRLWITSANSAVDNVEAIAATNLHKQWANRLLEPYLFVHGVITADVFRNFYFLRRALDAQPEFKVLADLMYKAACDSKPKFLSPGEWHLPYVNDQDIDWVHDHRFNDPVSALQRMSVARVARVSINPHDGTRIDRDKDFHLHDDLLTNKHMSPFEHQATADKWIPARFWRRGRWENPQLHGNFGSYIQYRKTIPDEFVPG